MNRLAVHDIYTRVDLLFSCDALCLGRWINGRFSPYCDRHPCHATTPSSTPHPVENLAQMEAAVTNPTATAELVTITDTRPTYVASIASPAPVSPSDHSRCPPLSTSHSSSRLTNDADIALSRLLMSGNFLTDLRDLTIEAVKSWSYY